MNTSNAWPRAAACALALLTALLGDSGLAAAPSLSGTVTSSAEGAMEGVLVSARREDSTITVTVVTDADGEYRFPRDRLSPGPHDVSIRAVGYVLPGTSRTVSVDVPGDGGATLDLRLETADRLELAYQLTDPEWFSSYPLEENEIYTLFSNCNRCHTMRRPSLSDYNAEQLAWVMKRMVYSAGSTPMKFQLPANEAAVWGRAEWGEPAPFHHQQAEAVARINLHDGPWDYELQTLPRPSGKETQVIYTTWELPVTARPHDTRIGDDGWIWFNHFNDNALGRLNPETGEVQQWRWPYMAEDGSYRPTGARTIMGPGPNGRFYIGNQAQDGLVIFDPATEEFEFRDPPGGGEMMDVSAAHVDGHGWRSDSRSAFRIDIETWEYTEVTGERPLRRYDIAADSRNGLFGGARGSDYLWYIDPDTLDVSYYDIPTEPRGVGGGGGGMRRGIVDGSDRLWWGGYDGNFVGVLDRSRPAGEEMTLYPVPFAWFFPYDAHHDDRGYTWTGGMNADRVARMNAETGEWLFYLLPFEANIRDIDLQPADGDGLSGLWIGHNHQGLITLVEPLTE